LRRSKEEAIRQELHALGIGADSPAGTDEAPAPASAEVLFSAFTPGESLTVAVRLVEELILKLDSACDNGILRGDAKTWAEEIVRPRLEALGVMLTGTATTQEEANRIRSTATTSAFGVRTLFEALAKGIPAVANLDEAAANLKEAVLAAADAAPLPW
jgi:hypothetical protein